MSLAKYSLNIYEKGTFEIIETLESTDLLWGDYIDIVEKTAKVGELKSEKELLKNFDIIQDTMFLVFPDLTKDKIKLASASEMMSTYKQIMALGQKFQSKNSKN